MAYAARRVEESAVQPHYGNYEASTGNNQKESDESVLTPHQLTQMLLDGAVSFTSQVIEAIESDDQVNCAYYIGRTVAILDGLCESLNKEKGGGIAENLEVVYLYAKQELLMAKEEKSAETLKKVVQHLVGISNSWRTIAV